MNDGPSSWSDADFIEYIDIHSRTELALVANKDVRRLLKLAGREMPCHLEQVGFISCKYHDIEAILKGRTEGGHMICICQYDGYMLLPDSMAKGTENRLLFEFCYDVESIGVVVTEGGRYQLVDSPNRNEKAIELLQAGDFQVMVNTKRKGERETHVFQIRIRDARASIRNLSVLVGSTHDRPMRLSFAATDWREAPALNEVQLH